VTISSEGAYKTQISEGMRIEWDVPIPVDDGIVLRCDVFRPLDDKPHPVIMSYGPYGKWLHFSDGFAPQWERFKKAYPEVLCNSSNQYQNFEVNDPERFVPDGYVIIRVDSRGTGRSPGFLDIWSAREARDFYHCIEWAATQPWSNGKVGLSGISYLAMNQWQVAALQPPHLTAMFVCEGASDYYREMTHHGGILCTFSKVLYGPAIVSVQHGRGKRGFQSRINGEWVSGPATLTEEQLGSNRRDWHADCIANGLASDQFWTSRLPDFSKIKVPFLSLANWGGQGLHLRGNIEGYLESASPQKWLEIHGREHWIEYYTDYGVDLQKRFFGHFLKGEDTGWSKQPRVQILVRHAGDSYVGRHEKEWPLARTQWTKFYLNGVDYSLTTQSVSDSASVTYRGMSDGVTFLTLPLSENTEITGPIAVKLFVSSATEDADLFVVVRAFSPDFRELTFQGHIDPHTTIAQGWLRASHRRLDVKRSLPYRPYHSHDEIQKLTPGEVYEVDVEVWPTCVVVPKGYRLALSIRGKDYMYPGEPVVTHQGAFTGVAAFRHDEPADRPAVVFDSNVTLHTGGGRNAYVLLPIIPQRAAAV
jgi:uncharacterized protein